MCIRDRACTVALATTVAFATAAAFAAGGLNGQVVLLTFGFFGVTHSIYIAVKRFGLILRDRFDWIDRNEHAVVWSLHQGPVSSFADRHPYAARVNVPSVVGYRFKWAFVNNRLIAFEALVFERLVRQQRDAAELDAFDGLPSFFLAFVDYNAFETGVAKLVNEQIFSPCTRNTARP